MSHNEPMKRAIEHRLEDNTKNSNKTYFYVKKLMKIYKKRKNIHILFITIEKKKYYKIPKEVL